MARRKRVAAGPNRAARRRMAHVRKIMRGLVGELQESGKVIIGSDVRSVAESASKNVRARRGMKVRAKARRRAKERVARSSRRANR